MLTGNAGDLRLAEAILWSEFEDVELNLESIATRFDIRIAEDLAHCFFIIRPYSDCI